MPHRRIRNVAIIERRQLVADLYLQGWTQAKIGEHVGVNQKTVSNDLRRIREEWRESAIRDFDEAREIELKKLDRIEREAWAAWERSKKPAQTATTNDESHQRKTRRQVSDRYGDPRFLELVNRCVASRCALLGLGMTNGSEGDADAFTFADRRDRILAIAVTLRERERAQAAGAGLGDNEPWLLCADREQRTVDAG